MKTVVVDRNLLEAEIKPHALMDDYRRLLAEEVKTRLLTRNQLADCPCTGCLAIARTEAFTKSGVTYLECAECKTVYASPRPPDEALTDFYRESRAARFWRERILPETREVRREKVFRPRAQWMLDVVDRYRPESRSGVIVGYHNDLLVEELFRQEKGLFRITVTNPIADIEYREIQRRDVMICPNPVHGVSSLGPTDLFIAFDILDRCADPDAVFASARETLAPGGVLLAGTTLISGFDLQTLWERSEAIYPPDRLNLFSVEGLTALSERHGFEALEFSTPGTFDVEIVQRAILAHPEYSWPRFFRYLIESRDESALAEFQEYLQKHRLSSFARVVLRKTC